MRHAANVEHQRATSDEANALQRVDEGTGCSLGTAEGTRPRTEHTELHLSRRLLCIAGKWHHEKP